MAIISTFTDHCPPEVTSTCTTPPSEVMHHDHDQPFQDPPSVHVHPLQLQMFPENRVLEDQRLQPEQSYTEKRLLEERLHSEQLKNAQLRAALEKLGEERLQMQSALAQGGRFMAVEAPGSFEDFENQRRDELWKAVQETRIKAEWEKNACVEQVKREKRESNAKAVERAVAECNVARDEDISRLEAHHRQALFEQRMLFKEKLLLIVPEMAHNLNRWHFGLLKAINNLVPTDAPGDPASHDNTPSRSTDTGRGGTAPASPAPLEPDPSSPNVQGGSEAREVHTPRIRLLGNREQALPEVGAARRSERGVAISKRTVADAGETREPERGRGAGLNTLEGAKRGANKATARPADRVERAPPANCGRVAVLALGHSTPSTGTGVARKGGTIKRPRIGPGAAKPREKRTAIGRQEAGEMPPSGGLGGLEMRTTWGTELLLCPNFVPECDSERWDRGPPENWRAEPETELAETETAWAGKGFTATEMDMGETELAGAELAGAEREEGERNLENQEGRSRERRDFGCGNSPIGERSNLLEEFYRGLQSNNERRVGVPGEHRNERGKESARGMDSHDERMSSEKEASSYDEGERQSRSKERPGRNGLREATGRGARATIPPARFLGREGGGASALNTRKENTIQKRRVSSELPGYEFAQKEFPGEYPGGTAPQMREMWMPPRHPPHEKLRKGDRGQATARATSSTDQGRSGPPTQKTHRRVEPATEHDKLSPLESPQGGAPAAQEPAWEDEQDSRGPGFLPRAHDSLSRKTEPPTLGSFNAAHRRRVKCRRRGPAREETFGTLGYETDGRNIRSIWVWCECDVCMAKGGAGREPITPQEFERHAGSARKNWRTSIIFADNERALRDELGDVPLQRAPKRV